MESPTESVYEGSITASTTLYTYIHTYIHMLAYMYTSRANGRRVATVLYTVRSFIYTWRCRKMPGARVKRAGYIIAIVVTSGFCRGEADSRAGAGANTRERSTMYRTGDVIFPRASPRQNIVRRGNKWTRPPARRPRAPVRLGVIDAPKKITAPNTIRH